MICLFLAGVNFSYAASDQTKNVNQGTALKVANDFLQRYGNVEAQWSDSIAQRPTLFFTPDGNPGVYVAQVVKKGNEIGFIVIGATNERSPIVKLSSGACPVNDLSTAKNKMTQLLKDRETLGEVKYIYAGPFMLLAQYPIITDEKKEVNHLSYNLQGNFVLDEVSTPVIPDEQKSNNMKAWDMILSSGEQIAPLSTSEYKNLSVRIYDQNDGMSPSVMCGPCSGAMVHNYWDEHGYGSLQDDGDRSDGEDLMNHLYYDMGTNGLGTSATGWLAGMKKHANECNNYDFTTSYDLTPTYSEYKSEINANRPLSLRFDLGGTPFSYHFVTGRGYMDGSFYIINNGWGQSETISVDECSWYRMCMVRP